MSRATCYSACFLLIPNLLIGGAYFHFLHERSDYLGHYLAGVGGTWVALVAPVALFIQMDAAIASSIRPGDHLQKSAWSRTLRTDDREIRLSWSNEVRGMIPTMACVIGCSMALATIAMRRSPPTSQ